MRAYHDSKEEETCLRIEAIVPAVPVAESRAAKYAYFASRRFSISIIKTFRVSAVISPMNAARFCPAG